MTDLVKRLRQIGEHDWRVSILGHASDTAMEAADEIERLRGAIIYLVNDRPDGAPRCSSEAREFVRKMKTSLDGLIANAGEALRKGDKSLGDYYAFSLEELKKHIEQTVRGEYTLAEFAEHYCVTLKTS